MNPNTLVCHYWDANGRRPVYAEEYMIMDLSDPNLDFGTDPETGEPFDPKAVYFWSGLPGGPLVIRAGGDE